MSDIKEVSELKQMIYKINDTMIILNLQIEDAKNLVKTAKELEHILCVKEKAGIIEKELLNILIEANK